MKTYGLLSAGNVQLHFIAVSPAAAPSPITYTTFLISFAVREHFFRERALTQLTEGCGCKGNFIVAISAFLALKDTPGGSMRPRPRRQLNLCLAEASWRRGGGAAGTRPHLMGTQHRAPQLLAVFMLNAYTMHILIKCF